ncbi:hypothetical protein [Roseovarius tolerans]|uniref:hypothetical protein n=1 Tax=Roseovarius tolerans TaxID=74031 RepID=UPI001113EF86|nr:hypothetical protein [Roseovarius tolerans]
MAGIFYASQRAVLRTQAVIDQVSSAVLSAQKTHRRSLVIRATFAADDQCEGDSRDRVVTDPECFSRIVRNSLTV